MFHYFRVSKKFIGKRVMARFSDFLSRSFGLAIAKYLIGEPVCAVFLKNSFSERVFW